jgi:predicted dithiol-disulfide oxidoreductase (DUF899 family)
MKNTTIPLAPELPAHAMSNSNGRSAPEESLVAAEAAAATSCEKPNVVARAEWLAARRELLREEKELTRRSDALAARRRALPWVRLEKPYRFEAPQGQVSLGELFGPHRQLVVQHFMFGPGWDEGCKSCSFMTDHIVPAVVHLAARDVAVAVISHAPLAESLPFKQRMGWDIPWVSSHGSDFNADFRVSYPPEAVARGRVDYNFADREVPIEELPGLSVFARDAAGQVYHTYSTYGRGVEVVMTTYRLLDLVPKGRDEASLEHGMAWVRHHDRYARAAAHA